MGSIHEKSTCAASCFSTIKVRAHWALVPTQLQSLGAEKRLSPLRGGVGGGGAGCSPLSSCLGPWVYEFVIPSMKVKSLVLGINPCAALGVMPLLGQVVTPGLGLLLLCAPNRGVGLGAWGYIQ